jgi:DNA-binding MarR family transcriptional regulator
MITRPGLERFESAAAARDEAEREVLERLNDDDRERLVTLLERLTGDEGG